MSIFEAAIGWLAPPECLLCGAEHTVLCELCAEAEILPHGERCAFCGAASPAGRTCPKCRRVAAPRHVWITTDYEGAAQKLLRAYKFGHLRVAATGLAGLMAGTYSFYNPDLSSIYLVVPIPTATSRRRARGFDHADLLAQKLATKLKIDYYRALNRLGQARQVGARRAQRQAQQAGAYRVRRADKLKGRRVLLIDDVITTGATLRAATKALRSAGAAQVDALVFAKRL